MPCNAVQHTQPRSARYNMQPIQHELSGASAGEEADVGTPSSAACEMTLVTPPDSHSTDGKSEERKEATREGRERAAIIFSKKKAKSSPPSGLAGKKGAEAKSSPPSGLA